MDYINSSRPTAVNLSWAIKEQKEIVEKIKKKQKRNYRSLNSKCNKIRK